MQQAQHRQHSRGARHIRNVRRVVGALAALAGACAGCNAVPEVLPLVRPGDVQPIYPYPLDDVLTLEHIQVKASHNSYHVATPDSVPEFAYTQAPLPEQLGSFGVRHLELDLHYDAASGLFRVFHSLIFDQASNCPDLVSCLTLVKTWSDGHRAHQPLSVELDIKDAALAPEAYEGYFAALEAAILSVWPQPRVLTPDEVQGGHATLPDALAADGWPTLGALRGRILFTLYNLGDGFGDAYTRGRTSLAGRLVFARAELGDPYAAVVHFDDPVSGAPLIAQALAAHCMVRTHADQDLIEVRADDLTRFGLALASGAQYIASDVPGPTPDYAYFIDVPSGTPARCNPVTAPPECTSEAIEDPSFVGP